MKIEKIKKMHSGKYKLIIDGCEDIVTYDEVILSNNLLNKFQIDEELLTKLKIDTEFYNIYNKVLNYIQVRLRSEKEISIYLKKFKLNEKEENAIISELKTNNFINDYNFAKAYIADKMNLSNYGPSKIKKDLSDHNIDEIIIEDLIGELDYTDIYEKLYHLIDKKILSNNKYSKFQLKSKILDNFISLGYSVDMIHEIFDELFSEDSNIIQKEYDKLYNNLKRKYSGDELFIKIKQKLYQKGYQMPEIIEIINENLE
ncbi:MAG: RecX family transcriptional regulator [Bacilli bacterium]|nr:RecX family transcriptional regulator [Bacilli bacterium]